MRKIVVIVALALSLVVSGMAGAESSHRRVHRTSTTLSSAHRSPTLSSAETKRPADQRRRKKCRRNRRRCKKPPRQTPPGDGAATSTALQS